MQTIITFKATETEPEKTIAFLGRAPSFNIPEDVVALMDYDHEIVSGAMPLKSIKSITWDEEE
jgi:hypothetical protein